MFDDRKVKYDVEFSTGDDVHLNQEGDNGGGRSWCRVTVRARYTGVKGVKGIDCVYIYRRNGEAVDWVAKYYDVLAEGAKAALYAQLTEIADRIGLDALIDPYEGDPYREVADLATSSIYTHDDSDWIWVKYDADGLNMTMSGPVERVLTVLRAVHGRD